MPSYASYDVFISHASEDKGFACRLAGRLEDAGLRVWYDSFVLKLGDSIRECVDNGLAGSRFGIVILSPAFFAKRWPKAELGALFARESAGTKLILPIWHGISAGEVAEHSPLLADRLSVSSRAGV